MGKLLFASIFILSNFLCVFGQTEEKVCPEITLTVPKNTGYMGRGDQYYLAVMVEGYDWEKLEYEWSLSGNIPFEVQGKPVISFIAKEEFDSLEIKATVKIKGLPEKCENTVSDIFEIQFDPGVPIELENYGKLTFPKEKIKLDNVVSKMNEYKNEDSIALFIIRYDEKDTKLTLRRRILRISNYLIKKHKLPKDKFNFILGRTGEIQTLVYLAPKSMGFEKFNWEESLEKLNDKTSKKSQ